jgi:hypothetical protein
MERTFSPSPLRSQSWRCIRPLNFTLRGGFAMGETAYGEDQAPGEGVLHDLEAQQGSTMHLLRRRAP